MALSKNNPGFELRVVLIKGDVFDRAIFPMIQYVSFTFCYKYLSQESLPLLLGHMYVTLTNWSS